MSLVNQTLIKIAAPILLLILWGCGDPVNVPPLTPQEIPMMEAAGNFPHQRYRIEPEDALQIRYTFHKEMDQDVIVRPDGKITANLVGEVVAAGLTTAKLGKLLAERTSDSLRNPKVVISITRFAARNVYIGGEVGKPGMIPYRKGLTPLQAVIAAGGFLQSARPESVVLVRTGGSQKNFISRKLNLANSIADGIKEPVFLAPHDVVYVPRSSIAEADLWVKQHVSDLFPFLKGSAGVSYKPGF